MNRFQIVDTTPFEFSKLFSWDHWVGSNPAFATPEVNSYSIHFWVYLACIVFVALVAFAFRFYKGYFLDKETLYSLATENTPNNPIFSKLSFFENYFLINAYLFAFFFLARQTKLLILSNKLFILASFVFFIVGILLVIKYFLTDKKIEEEYFNARKRNYQN
ncbi:MAG: hypothetical protein ACRCXZ_01925 [Patescibacteria group bacterium]